MTSQGQSRDDGTVAAVLRLADLAGKIERVENAVTRRIDELARDCAAAQEQVDGLCGALGALTGRADEIEQRLAEVSALLGRMSGQISALTTPPGEADGDDRSTGSTRRLRGGSPPTSAARTPPTGWLTGSKRCTGRSTATSPTCWHRAGGGTRCAWPTSTSCTKPGACSTSSHRDPKMVFAQLDWLTRSLLQAAEVMANETRRCRDLSRHCEPGQDTVPFPAAPRLNARR